MTIELHGRYHIFATFKYIKYGFVICFVPLINAIIKFNLPALFTALRQDAVILAVMVPVSLILWRHSNFTLTDSEFCTSNGIFVFQAKHFSRAAITAVELHRSFYLRPIGATQLIIYFKSGYPVKSCSVYLKKADACRIADILAPVRKAPTHYEPSGWERISFVMLSANIITTAVFVIYTFNRISKLFGDGVKKLALIQFYEIEQIVSAVLPAGVSAVFTLCLIFIFLSVLISFLRTAGFSVSRADGIIISRGGLITKVERRIIAGCITYSDIRITPVARILRRYPVYIAAGGYEGGDMPLLVYRYGQEENIRRVLPEFDVPKKLHTGGGRRTVSNFLWRAYIYLAVMFVLIAVSTRTVPGLTLPLYFLLVLVIAYTACSLIAYFQEGFRLLPNRTLFIRQNRAFTMHLVSVYTHDFSVKYTQTPLAAKDGKCAIRVYLPNRKKFTVRAVSLHTAKDITFYM